MPRNISNHQTRAMLFIHWSFNSLLDIGNNNNNAGKDVHIFFPLNAIHGWLSFKNSGI